MNTIVLKDKNKKAEAIFSNFECNFDDVLKLISFNIEIVLAGINIKAFAEAEQSDFIFLLNDLNRINLENKGVCSFNPMGEKIFIRFTIIQELNLKIDIELKDDNFISISSISFFSDITYINEIVNDIESIIKIEKYETT